MIELIIAFLISIGWITPENADAVEVIEQNENTFGIVITDETSPREATIFYDKEKDTFVIL